ncbi:MAG: FAD-dependent monooxygenase [Rhodocyclaceae bacterium]|nr:FAD-dependent monooxygenase [Rhodocyclaceae bacterium]
MTEVLVVGGGPVGLMTALGLAKAGVNVTVIEAEANIVYSPRAIAYAWTILPALEYFGLLEDMIAAGHTTTERSFRIFRTNENIVYNHDVLAGITDHPYSLTLGQDLLAEVVLKHLERYPNATVRWNTKFTAVTQSSHGAIVKADTPDGPTEFTAKWVVAADGGRSPVRHAVGMSLEGFTWPRRFVVTNIYYDFAKYGWDSGYLIDRKYGTVIYKLNQEGLWRYTFSEDAGLPLETVSERIAEFIKTTLPGDKKYELALSTTYAMHQRSAPRYRAGRVLLAGDSAHLTNPTSGFGLMGGMNDAFLLSETLAAVLKGEVGEEYLDRYATLRKKVFEEVTSPISTGSFKLLFELEDEATMEKIFTDLRNRPGNPEAMLKWHMLPSGLETPSLLTGLTYAQRLGKKPLPGAAS